MQNDIPFPEDMPINDVECKTLNKFTISQSRYLFTCILSQFEREMPVSNHKK